MDQPKDDSVTFLDHTGHFVPDESAARAALLALGFTVTPFSAQTEPDPDTGAPRLTGTGNICVMLETGYLEFLLHTADTPIGLEFKAAVSRRAGLHLAAFAVADAVARHAALAAKGVPMRPVARFSRPIATPDGETTAAFTVARLAKGVLPEGRVQMVTHHTPAALWQPRWTQHANGATALRGVVVSAPEPAGSAERFAQVLLVPAVPQGDGFSLRLARGVVDILPEPIATALAGQEIDPQQAAFSAVRIAVADLAGLQARLAANGIAFQRDEPGLVVPFDPALGRGAWIFQTA